MFVFLSTRSATHSGAERPSDLLFGEGVFVTAVGEDDHVRFIHKDAVAWMTVASELEMSGRCEAETKYAESRCHPIDLVLDDGRSFVGEVAIMQPEGRARLQDFLNESGRFLEVRGPRGVHFVNRDRIAMVTATG